MCLLSSKGKLASNPPPPAQFGSEHIITYKDASSPTEHVLTNQGQEILTLWFYSSGMSCVSIHLH